MLVTLSLLAVVHWLWGLEGAWAAVHDDVFVGTIDHNHNRLAGVAIYTVVRDEEPYIEEWIMYRLFTGVEMVYVLDNSDDGSHGRLLAGRANVTVVPWSPLLVAHLADVDPYDFGTQGTAIRFFMRQLKERHRWALHIDVDEFVVLRRHGSITDLAEEYLGAGKHAGLALPWLDFGCSGHVLQDDAPVVTRFTQRAPKLSRHHHIKTLFVCAEVKSMAGPHNVKYNRFAALPTGR